ncbi:FecR family protein [Flagellimonas sp.]|uniref:FecR family protein n=1 Tax=Flagellimonas sp. TaxID=2058762 RepID=UPI003BA9293F
MEYRLITKYLSEAASEAEVAQIFQWIEASSSNKEAFMEIKKIWALGTKGDEDIEKAWYEIQERLKIISRRRKRTNILKYAAIFIGLVAGAYVWLSQEPVENPGLIIEDSAVVLSTGDNTTEKLNVNSEQNFSTQGGKVFATQVGNKIVYNANESIKELVYNEIKVPHGKTFQLVLSDGSLVHLNSGTSMKFPVNFLPDQERRVYLDGEAYFEVAKDKKRPFLVEANNIDVQVLGTHFNVSSYKGTEPFAVLVEGSVSVSDKHEGESSRASQVIVPGQKASLTSNGFAVEEVDVNDYLEWRQGRLIFNNESFQEIVYKIERRYNVEINNSYTELDPIKFNGKFGNETIIDLLDTFKESAGFDYYIEDNKVIINQPN